MQYSFLKFLWGKQACEPTESITSNISIISGHRRPWILGSSESPGIPTRHSRGIASAWLRLGENKIEREEWIEDAECCHGGE
ncbi:hypothetical protein EVAR_8939_1 [Eumeta japonica]|uniref:Uncharacterized protein n=1 Tax=Eumeta variegata TaxID=151549 RepID=A0A4C1U0G0_EUMVA|nr:hypothetical protein EVAR_8939_1 [Eumeta japonica]